MIKKREKLFGLLAILIIAFSCGNSKKDVGTENISGFFPDKLDEINLARTSEIRTFKGQSLYEYIDGGAEIYHQYGFVELATASYKADDQEIILDIYKFDNEDNAYGLYSAVKPPEPGNMQLGAEGFSTENSVDFVKGSYLVRIVGFDETETTKQAIEKLAENLDAALPGSINKPATFELFPRDSLVPGSEKMQAESFLGQIFLDDVYSVEYDIDGDKVTLFVTEDSSGEKYTKWLAEIKTEEFDPKDLPYEDQKAFLYNNDYHGAVVAGSIQGRLAGLIGYKESHREFLSRWLESLKEPDKESI